MRIDIKVEKGEPMQQTTRQAQFISSEMILCYLMGTDEQLETFIMCKPESIELVTTDNNIYEALGSIRQYDNIAINRLTKFMEVVNVISYKEKHNQAKPILKEERVEELRRMALSKAKSQEE